MNNQQSHELTLPNEILLKIVQDVDKVTLKSLRLSCKAIRAFVDPIFSDHYFRHVKVLTTEPALERLKAICSSQSIAPYMTSVAFLTLKPTWKGLDILDRWREQLTRLKIVSGQLAVTTILRSLHQALCDYEEFDASGRMMASIQLSLERLRRNDNPNVHLAIFEARPTTWHLDWVRKFFGWNLKGNSELEKILIEPELCEAYCVYRLSSAFHPRLNHIWKPSPHAGARIVLALARSGLFPSRLTLNTDASLVCSPWPQQYQRMEDVDELCVNFRCDELRQIGRNLTEIHINIDLRDKKINDDCGLLRIIRQARRLETLVIKGGSDQYGATIRGLVDDLLSDDLIIMGGQIPNHWRFEKLLDALHMQRLSTIRLDNMFIAVEALFGLLHGSAATLVTLEMSTVVLVGEPSTLRRLRLPRLQHVETVNIARWFPEAYSYFEPIDSLDLLGYILWNVEEFPDAPDGIPETEISHLAPEAKCAIKSDTHTSDKCWRQGSAFHVGTHHTDLKSFLARPRRYPSP